MEITIQMPKPITLAKKAAAMSVLERQTSRTIKATIVESPDYDPYRVDVRGTVKGVGPKTWEKWTTSVRVALSHVV